MSKQCPHIAGMSWCEQCADERIAHLESLCREVVEQWKHHGEWYGEAENSLMEAIDRMREEVE